MSAVATPPVRIRQRLAWVDAARGAAILLMLLDHVLFQIDASSPLRSGHPWSVTRWSLPLFMLAAGAVPRSSTRRRVALLAVLPVEALLYYGLGMPMPGILAVFVVATVVLDVAADLSIPLWWVGAAGLVASLYWPVRWDGYELGLVVCWLVLGRLAVLDESPWRFPSPRWLCAVGRYPLSWYLGHLVALVVLVELGALS